MSGHNKWANIKHKKAAQDAKRSKLFSRLSKEIQIAVKEGGADPSANPRLRMAIQNARAANMPKANIEKAIYKGEHDPNSLEEVTFEGYAAGGVALFLECMTDNNNRTVSNVRAIFNKYNGSMGKKGSLSFVFARKGSFIIPEEKIPDKEEFELEMIDAGAEDIEFIDGKAMITTSFEDYGNMQKKLEELGIEPESAELVRVPLTTVKVDAETAKKVLKMIEAFEDLDDVQNVFHNMELTEEIEQLLTK